MFWRSQSVAVLTLFLCSLCAFSTTSRTPVQAGEHEERRTTRTMGGRQLWTDHFVHHGWRIQRYVLTGHYRLLDEQNRRHAWGSQEQCRAEFERLRTTVPIPDLKPRVVITLHGLGRSRQSLQGMGEFLAKEADFDWINVSYASTRDDLAAHSKALDDIVNGLDGVEEINFVAHSLGNLVIRRYLQAKSEAKEPDDGPRIGRIVMLAPPNGGAEMAARLQNVGLFHFLVGTSGSQLAREWTAVQKTLATPQAEFGIIAGEVSKPTNGNPAIAGPDDLVVSVEETKLSGARDLLIVPAMHTFIMDRNQVRDAVLTFLQNGYFVTEEKRQPIQ